ncbi:cadherin-like beta sandwich domain-containing protein [Phosphitispora sp. TUW77]|uniref:cadherin-like beta sandwich domain-containing protein n=1 Tax=Phosphitispora sp. TUW77 TaxID=3152361 RepID=UPI003AB3109E
MNKKSLSRWLLTILMMLLLLAVMSATVLAETTNVYVDPVNGDDANSGSLGEEVKTIERALELAPTNAASIICLREGDYSITTYITHQNLTITAYDDGNGNYDNVTIYPDYDSTLTAPNQIWTTEWIFAADSLASKLGLTLSHLNLSGDNLTTGEPEDGSAVTGMYTYSADGAGSYVTLEDCTISDMQVAVLDKYSDYLTVSILNCDIEAFYPVRTDNTPYLLIYDSTIQMSSTDLSGDVIYLNGTPTVDIQGNTIIGNNGNGTGIYEDVRNGTISNNTFLDLDTALELSEIGNLTVSGNYVETTNNGFDLETYYYNPASITVSDNTIINKTLENHYQTGIKLYLNDDTGGSTFNVYGNEIVNFAYGFYYDGDDYYSDLINLNLSNAGSGNKFRGNILNMYIESLRSTSQVDMCQTDWGTTDRQEIFDRIYFRDIYPASDGSTAAATHEEAFIFDDTFSTIARDVVYVDDDFSSSTPGFGVSCFNNISEAKSMVRSGGIVNVAEGLYDEQVSIFHPVTIQGIGENAVIKNTADTNKPIMLVSAPNTTISGMNFQEGTYGLSIGDFDYCRNYLNSSFNFTYYDSMADNTTVYNNYFGNQSYTSINIDYQNYPATLDGLTVEGNIFNSDTSYTYNALVSRSDFVIDSPTIKDNQIEYNYMNGFRFRFAGDALIQGNDIVIDGDFLYPYENKGGFIIYPEGNCLITGNTFELADGVDYASSANDSVGFRYDVDTIPAELITADFYNNNFSGFDYALYFYAYGIDLQEGTIDVTVGGSNENYNDLSNNTYGVVSQYKPVAIDASCNVWGVADEDIPGMILDFNDESYYGIINYLPSAVLTSDDPELSDLQASPVSLVPSFDPEVHEYMASAANEVTAVTITPSADAGTIYVNDTEAASASSVEIPLAVGDNTVSIEVYAEDGITNMTYTIVINRAISVPEPDATLSGLSASGITLTPEFDSATTSYSANVSNNVSSTTITAEPSEPLSDVSINDTEGTSKEVILAVGDNTVSIEVYAEDGITNMTYTIVINRAASTSTGSSGSSYTPPVIDVTTQTTDDSTTTSTEISVTTSSSGVAEASISTAMVDALLDEADAEDGTSKEDIIEVSVNTPADTSTIEVNIPQAELEKIAENSDAGFGIASPLISITFDGKAIETISAAAAGGNVTVSAGIIDNSRLSEQDQAKVADRPVYDLGVKNGDVQVSHFGGGHATVRIPYTLKQGENPNAVVIYYLGNDGSLKTVRGHFDATAGVVVFKTPHFSNFVIGHNPVVFNDVKTDVWYKDAVDFIAARGITTGTGDDSYSPEMQLTRGQFMVLLMNAYQIEPASGSDDQTGNFADAGNTYYTGYLAAAKTLGIANGVGNNMFAPEKAITRQEMFVLLYNALKLIDELPPAANDRQLAVFNDAGLVASWANEAMSSLVQSGIVSGSNNMLSPAETTTRAQMAQVLYNLLSK